MTDTELTRRLERLERDNRWLKRFGLTALAIVAVIGTIAATQPVPQKITAREFDLVDNSGTVRAALKMEPPLTGPVSKALRSANPGFTEQPSPKLYMEAGFEQDGQSGTARTVLDANGVSSSAVGPRQFEMATLTQGQLLITGESPNVHLVDGQGFQMDLGSRSTVTPATGATHQTSAASILMFGNDKKHSVIWRAP